MSIHFVIYKVHQQYEKIICCLLRSQRTSFYISITLKFIGIDLSLWHSWGSRFECQPGLAVGPRTRVAGRQGS